MGFYRLLTVGLRPSHYLWRSMAKLRTAFVVFILVYTSQYGPFIHVFAYTAALTVTSIMEVVADPYRMIRIKAVGAVDGSKTASQKRTDVEHQNVFQKMRNYSVVIALGTIFLGSVQLGAESDQQWREHWWIDWKTLSDLLAAMTIIVNVIYMAWMIQTVSSQFGRCKCLCPCLHKKPTRKLASITPELQQRRASASHKILKSLSHAAVSSKAKKLTEWKQKAEHEASAARLMSLANTHVPPTSVLPVLPKPSEAVVIQRVVEAGNKFAAAAEKKSAQEVQREKLLELAKQARVRVRRKKTKKVRVKRKKTGAIAAVTGGIGGEGSKDGGLPVPPTDTNVATAAKEEEASTGGSKAETPKTRKKSMVMPDSDSDDEAHRVSPKATSKKTEVQKKKKRPKGRPSIKKQATIDTTAANQIE